MREVEDMPFEDAVEFWAYAYACCIVLSGNMELSTEVQQSLVKDLAEKILAGRTDKE